MTDAQTIKYEDKEAQIMQEFTVSGSAQAFTISTTETPEYTDETTGQVFAAIPAKIWAMPKSALALMLNKRADTPGLFDFVQAAWTFKNHLGGGSGALIKPSESEVKLALVQRKMAGDLLDTLGITTYPQFRELRNAVDLLTSTGAIRAAEMAAVKEAAKAAAKAKRDADPERAAKAKERQDKIDAKAKEKADKVAAKAKEKQDKIDAKAAEKAKSKAQKDAEKAEKKQKELDAKEEAKGKKAAEKAKANTPLEEAAMKAELAKIEGDLDKDAAKTKAKPKSKYMTKEAKAELARVEAEEAAKAAAKVATDSEFDETGTDPADELLKQD